MKKILVVLIGFFPVFGMNLVVGQSVHNCDSHNCSDFDLINCRLEAESQLNTYLVSIDYQGYFFGKYGLTVTRFTELNQIHTSVIRHNIIDGLCMNSIQLENVVSHIDTMIEGYQNDIWLEEPQNLNPDVIHVGKYYTIPKEDNIDNETYTFRAAGEPCNNPDFETCDYTGWETYCGSVNNSPFQIVNISACTPSSPVTSGSNQHLIVSGGTDPVVPISINGPELGSCIARVGDGTGTNYGAGILRQTFLVDAASTILIYRYAAILQNGGTSHTINDQAFVRVRLFDENNQSISCAEYEAYAGDGQPGWITSGAVEYRDWTTVFTSLENYVGQNVTMEFAVGDCGQGGHYGYAYVDAECGILEIEAYCEGQNTILRAPDGAASYLWSTGETTQEIAINTAGNYWCEVIPVQGADCSVLVEIDIEPFPVPQSAFLAAPIEICQGDQIQFSDGTTIDDGGVITTYQWDFGDGIETPHSSGPITGVTQTTGTYTLANHQYPNSGVYDVALTVYSADGCYDSYISQVTVNPLPTAIISGSSNVCLNDAEPQITFTAANGVSPYTFTYNINGGPDMIVVTAAGDNTVDVSVPTNNTGTFNYSLVSILSGSGSCGQAQAGLVTVLVSPLPEASISGTTTICVNAPEPQVTFTGQNGTPPYTFTYNINGGANQVISTTGVSSSVAVNVPTGVAGNFVYNLINVEESSASQCSQNQNESVVVEITPLPTATISGNISVCQYDINPDVLFEGANASNPYTFTYNINGGTSQVVTTQVGNDVTLSAPTNQVGTFNYNLLSVEDVNGCVQTQLGTISVEVNPLPTATITGTTQVCLNDAQPLVTLEGQNGVEPFTFTYSLNGGANQTISTTGGNTVTIPVPTDVAGNFVFNLFAVEESSPMTCGQVQAGSVTVTVYPLPVVSAGNDISVCEGYTVVLTGSGATTYEWDNGAINGQSFIPTISGTYTVIGTDNNGCQSSDQMDVIWTPTPQVNFTGDVLDGCVPVLTEFTANTTGNIASCLWNFGNGITSNDCNVTTHSFNGIGCFTVSYTVTTVEGCVNTQTIPQYVCAYPYPVADFTPSPNVLSTLLWESQMMNESVGANSYNWDFGDGSAYSSEFSPIHEFPSEEGGAYLVTLIAYSAFGCPDTISQLIVVNEEPIYYVPNAFTPDNDNFNEVFKPIFTFGFDPYNFNMLIFNRWGEVLFESNDVEVGWNGTYGGNIVQDGVYIWKITFKVKGVDKRQVITGHVTLIR